MSYNIGYMKKLISLLSFLLLAMNLFPAEKKILESKNEYGGETVEFTIYPEEKDYEQFSKVVFFYDEANNKRKTVYYLSEKVQQESGYEIQEEFYENGNPVEYRMHFSPAEIKIRGIKTVIEKTSLPEYLIYTDGEKTVYSNMKSFVHNYPILTLNYLKDEIIKDADVKKSDRNKYLLSSKYFKARSFVTFTSDFMGLNELDKKLISHYSTFINNHDMVNLYAKKAYVQSAGKQYTVYIQTNLEPYIKKGLSCLLAYGIIGCNNDLYLISVEFEELAK